ncbi:rhomboid family intramembrane serine protease [Planctomicrobium sp. SH661]|uniref:rhomboid family intramembrane serine protease n=1 Tax=Planctomicrobium sp. SH661 TaxID=3448124 RepID=UPI003F5B31E9
MGIDDRGYMSNDSTSQWSPGRRRSDSWSMVTTLIVINVVVFIAQTITWRTQLLESWLALNLHDVLHGQIWRLTTYDFLHETSSGLPLHLLFNMWLLYLAGRRVEDKYGSEEFLAFYLVAGVLSGIGFLAWGLLTQTGGVAIGASGAAVAVMIVYAFNWPSERWYIWGILPVPVIMLAAISAIFDVMPMLQQLRGNAGPGDRVAHAAHVGGMLFGLLYVKFGWRITSLFSNLNSSTLHKSVKRRPKLRVHVPNSEEIDEDESIPEAIESRLDRLLEKISVSGEASLTDEERRFLTDASRRYRNRK